MSLVGFQTVLGRSLRGATDRDLHWAKSDDLGAFELSPDEHASLRQVLASPGFRFTVAVRRSWCEGRAATTARHTLSILSAKERQGILADWVDQGAGTRSFVASEAEAFLEFIASRLPNPSHARTLCRVEQAAYRASSQEGSFEPPPPSVLSEADAMLRPGTWATLVPFFVEPDDLLAALRRDESLRPFAQPIGYLLFAPGIQGLFRRASRDEVHLWARLAPTVPVRSLFAVSRFRRLLEPLLAVGAIEVGGVHA